MLKLAAPNAPEQMSPSKLFRAPDGKMRVDAGNVSTIADPAAQKMMILDHVKKEFKIVPIPQAPAAAPFQAPGMPPMPMPGGAAPLQPPKVEELGKGFIEGHEVEGKRYTFQPPPPPQPPQMPQKPQMPQIPGAPALQKPALPGMPQPPQAPAPPVPPPPPTVSEVWTSTKLKLPVLTKTEGPFGKQVCQCKYSEMPPPPHLFQVPPDYKMVTPPPPTPPAMPKAPAFPK